MKSPTPCKIVFPNEYLMASRSRKKEIKEEHKSLLSYYIRLASEREPMLSAAKAKAKGVQNFLFDAGLDVLCIDSIEGGGTGLLIVDRKTKNELAFIKTNSVLINVIYDLYFEGILANSGGQEKANIQGSLGF